MLKVAIMIDGGFFQKRIKELRGKLTAVECADFLFQYCQRHAEFGDGEESTVLYKIFYYDCLPSGKVIFNPITKQQDDLSKTETHSWMEAFFKELTKKRKVAIRRGRLSDEGVKYTLRPHVLDRIIKNCKNGSIGGFSITQSDLTINVMQKGVDMKLGLDIASLAYKKQVDKIILIAGDSDFVPAAKLARREGIDFILDPLWKNIKDDLFEHIDGLRTCKDLLPRPEQPRYKRGYK